MSDTLRVSRSEFEAVNRALVLSLFLGLTGVGEVSLCAFVSFPNEADEHGRDRQNCERSYDRSSCLMASTEAGSHVWGRCALRAHVWVVADSLVPILFSIMIDV